MSQTYPHEDGFLDALRDDDPRAYRSLVETFHPMMCAYAMGLTKDRSTAEDIVQNVFVKLWKRRQMLHSGISLKSYLYRSVYNEFVDQDRKRLSNIEVEKKYVEALNRVVHHDDHPSQEQLVQIVWREIAGLPPKCRRTFLLSKQEGLSNREISEHLGIPLKTVESHITQAFKILKRKVPPKAKGIFVLIAKVPNAKGRTKGDSVLIVRSGKRDKKCPKKH